MRARQRLLHRNPVGAPEQREHAERNVGAALRSHRNIPARSLELPAKRRSCRQKVLHRRRHRRRLIVMQHVARIRDRHHRPVAECARSGGGRRRTCRWRLRLPDDRRATSGCSSPWRRSTASAPRCCARSRRSPRSGTRSERATGGADRRRGESARPASPPPNARRETAPCRAAAADCFSAADPRRHRSSRTARSPCAREARRATSRVSPVPRPVPPRGCRKPSSEITRARAPDGRPHSASRRCRRGCARRDRRSRPARTRRTSASRSAR